MFDENYLSGIVHLGSRQFREAVNNFIKAWRFDKNLINDLDFVSHLGQALCEKGFEEGNLSELNRALEYLSKIMRKRGNANDAYWVGVVMLRVGIITGQKKQLEDAKENFEITIQLRNQEGHRSTNETLLLAITLTLLGIRKNCAKQLKQASKKLSSIASQVRLEPLFWNGFIQLMTGNYSKAYTTYSILLQKEESPQEAVKADIQWGSHLRLRIGQAGMALAKDRAKTQESLLRVIGSDDAAVNPWLVRDKGIAYYELWLLEQQDNLLQLALDNFNEFQNQPPIQCKHSYYFFLAKTEGLYYFARACLAKANMMHDEIERAKLLRDVDAYVEEVSKFAPKFKWRSVSIEGVKRERNKLSPLPKKAICFLGFNFGTKGTNGQDNKADTTEQRYSGAEAQASMVEMRSLIPKSR